MTGRVTILTRSLAVLVATCVLASLVLAAAMSFIDWRANPGGLFRSDAATHWSVVAQTASSWFFPSLVLFGGVAASLGFVGWVVGRIRGR